MMDLVYRFNISQFLVINIFYVWLDVFYILLGGFVKWFEIEKCQLLEVF